MENFLLCFIEKCAGRHSFAHQHGCRNINVWRLFQTSTSRNSSIYWYIDLTLTLKTGLFTLCKSFVKKVIDLKLLMTLLQTKSRCHLDIKLIFWILYRWSSSCFFFVKFHFEFFASQLNHHKSKPCRNMTKKLQAICQLHFYEFNLKIYLSLSLFFDDVCLCATFHFWSHTVPNEISHNFQQLAQTLNE